MTDVHWRADLWQYWAWMKMWSIEVTVNKMIEWYNIDFFLKIVTLQESLITLHARPLTQHPLTCWNLNHGKHPMFTSLVPTHFIHLLPIHHWTEICFQTISKHYFLMCSTWESFQIMHWFQWPVSLTQT